MSAKDPMQEAAEKLQEQNEELKRLAEQPKQLAFVSAVEGDFVFLGSGGGITRVVRPKSFKVEPGDPVLILPQTGQIFEKIDMPYTVGGINVVKQVYPDNYCEIDGDGSGSGTVIMCGKVKVEPGDRVLLDPGRTMVMKNLGKNTAIFRPEAVPTMTWNDIGGLEEAKALMIEAIELPHRNKQIFEYYGKRPSKGVLLYGPPGCGKTMLGKAAAASLARIYNKEISTTGFMYVKGPEILDKYVGVSEGTVRTMFRQAEEHKAKSGYPAVIFIDEADAILGKRGDRGHILSNTIVPMFLTEMDGLQESAAIVILATNRPDVLDPAVVRDGRIDRKIKIGRPGFQSTKDILLLNMKGVPFAEEDAENLEEVATQVTTEIFSKERGLFRMVLKEHSDKLMTLKDTINGAMIAGIVDFGMSLAIRRDLIARKKKGSGVTRHDLLEAVERIDVQALDLDHTDAIADFIEPFEKQVTEIVRMRRAISQQQEENYAEAAE